ncbi:hypothetical protein VTL71DRAFT_95 [Oculimacula yallundae]|uniref:F-box domain-containing protein n=1 Tax=Oculimacula yallundae TaxID=86028 RepID=A0ABR4CZ09_9HELO
MVIDLMDTDEVRKALDNALRELARLKGTSFQSAATNGRQIANRDTKCRFLECIPLEVRKLIYRYLLINPDLADIQSVMHCAKNELDHPSQAYELSPAILRTCHQVYIEASDILYGSNTFIADLGQPLCSPLLRTRVFDDTVYGHSYKPIRIMRPATFDKPAVRKARRWKLVPLAGRKALYHKAEPGIYPRFMAQAAAHRLAQLCYQLACSTPNYLEVIFDINCTADEVEKEVRRLRFLRNIGCFKLHCVPAKCNVPQMTFAGMNAVEHLESDLSLLLQSSSPTDNLEKMYESLKDYCDSLGYDDSRLVYLWNSGVLDCNDVLFKSCRRQILERLELQYRNIMVASLDLTDFVKSEKNPRGMFCHKYPDFKANLMLGEALTFLYRYDQSFFPVLKLDEMIAKSRYTDLWNHYRSSSSLSIWLGEIRKSITEEDLRGAIDIYKTQVDTLDECLLRVRSARVKLFNFDGLQDPKCGDFDVEAWRCDEMIDWDVDEPQMTPEKDPHATVSLNTVEAPLLWQA